MVFGIFQGGKEAKLKEERQNQEHVITEQLKALKLDHELQRQNMTQKGLIAQQKMEADRKRQEEEIAAANEKGRTTNDAAEMESRKESSQTKTDKAKSSEQLGPRQKLAQHMDMARKGYEQLVNAIIRPPRCDYSVNHLGSASFTFLKQRFEREDVTLMTERGYRIHCSHWKQVNDPDSGDPKEQEKSDMTQDGDSKRNTVVVYMHGNASARVEVLQQLSYLLSLGTSVFAFDFAGSGMSDGDYVSLGYYEREDLATVVAHLRAAMGSDVKICLWGRSMGAATALMYASREASMQIQNVSCLVLDSSFSDLIQLATEMVDKAREQGIVVPGVVVSVALAAIGWSVQNKANFDIRDISPVKHAASINIPALVVCGEQDDFIKPHHSERICENYKGSKNLLMVQGDHNDVRPPILLQAASQFLSKHLLGDMAPGCLLEVPQGMNLQTAPWQFRNSREIFQSHFRASPKKVSTGANQNTLSKQSSTVSNTSMIDVTEIGMTKERQDDIQSSLVTMLGQEQKPVESDAKHAMNDANAKSQEGEEIVLEEDEA